MGLEIERKFQVNSDLWNSYKMKKYEEGRMTKSFIRQGYLSTDPKKTVRVRLYDQKALITVKGINQGISRQEFEYTIPYEDAEKMLKMCDGVLEKIRYSFIHGLVWTVDEFLGAHEGLIIAEVELSHETEYVDIPNFITQEVSNHPNFYNSNLIFNEGKLLKNPYKK